MLSKPLEAYQLLFADARDSRYLTVPLNLYPEFLPHRHHVGDNLISSRKSLLTLSLAQNRLLVDFARKLAMATVHLYLLPPPGLYHLANARRGLSPHVQLQAGDL